MKIDLVQRVKESLDLRQLISQYVPIKKGKIRCPFHQDKHPSLSIHPTKQIWKCFACGEGGDIFTFIQLIENVNFKEALSILAQEAGIVLPKSKRFQRIASRRWSNRKRQAEIIYVIQSIIKRAYQIIGDYYRESYKVLPTKKSWDSWGARDYLIIQQSEILILLHTTACPRAKL